MRFFSAMRIGSRQFSPSLWATTLYVAVLAAMLWLGNWQLERAALKVSLQQAAAAASDAQAVPLAEVDDWATASEIYRRVSLTGRFDGKRQFLWDNRTYKGRAGFEVIVPFQVEDGSWVLVNRGWIAPGVSRSQLPEVALPVPETGQNVSIEGFLSRPSKGFASGDAVSAVNSWPRVLQYLDYDALALALGAPVVPALVQAQSVSADGLDIVVPTSRPEWLIANWQPAASGPAKHYSYAFQWFAMSMALSILFVIVNTRKSPTVKPDRVENNE